jgi:molybdopterin synthase catalytic subunit
MIRLQREDFDIGREVEALTRDRSDIGAVVTFTGLVRDTAHGTAVSAIELEHYPVMAERELARIEEEAIARFRLQASLVIHRFGKLEKGARIVLVVTAAAHRADAFAAAELLMDYLKTRAPFWKREVTGDGLRWVEAETKDDEAAARWRG